MDEGFEVLRFLQGALVWHRRDHAAQSVDGCRIAASCKNDPR